MLQEKPLASSMADAVWYDRVDATLFVRYRKTQRIYKYAGVGTDVFNRLMTADSFGTTMNRQVIQSDNFPVSEVRLQEIEGLLAQAARSKVTPKGGSAPRP